MKFRRMILGTAALALSGCEGATEVIPTKLTFTVQPTSSAAGSPVMPPVQVAAQDGAGKTARDFTGNVTLTIGGSPTGATLTGTLTVAAVAGVATFTDLRLDKPGAGYTLAAAAPALSGATSDAFNVMVGTASKLGFVTQPGSATAGAPITPTIQVAIQDAAGNTVISATTQVSISIGNNPGGGSLSGTAAVAASAGVATFSDLRIAKAATGYTLSATAPGLPTATSTPFNVVTAPAVKLAFTVQPATTTAGAAISPAVQLVVQDSVGNTVTAASNIITLVIAAGPGGATLVGTTSASATAGVATFSNLRIAKAGNGYRLGAAASGLSVATSSIFSIAVGPPDKLGFTGQPSNVVAATTISPAVAVAIQDSMGNTVTSATNAVTIALGTNPGGGTLSGTTTVPATDGIAIFRTLNIDNVGAGYRLAASASGFAGATSASFSVCRDCWTAKAAPPVPRADLAVGEANGLLYQVGGYDGNSITRAVDAYDPATDNWIAKNPTPTSRSQVGIGVVGNVLYVVGGYVPFGPDSTAEGSSYSRKVEAYDPGTNNWTTKASMPTRRRDVGVGVVNGILYAVGGISLGSETAAVEAYDPVADMWTSRASMSAPHTVRVGVINGILYAVGSDGTLQAYDPAANTWTTKAPMPAPRNAPAVGVIDGTLYVAGGCCTGPDPSSSVYAYDPGSNSWAPKTSMPAGRAFLAGGVVNGAFYAVGGLPDLSRNEAYRP